MFVVTSFGIIAALAFLVILGTSAVLIFNVYNNKSNRASRQQGGDREVPGTDRKRRALDIVSQQLPHTPAYKCGNCGATVDSTAELSPDGKVRCNYCNEWSSIL